MTGDPHLAVAIAGELHEETLGNGTVLTDRYVASGATMFHFADAAGIHPGDTLLIVKQVTPECVQRMGMDTLRRSGKPEHWVSGELEVRREVASVAGNAVTLVIPLMDSYDAKYLGNTPVTVSKVRVSGQISGVGVEGLRIVASTRSVTLNEPQFDGIRMDNAVDSWVQTIAFEETSTSVNIAAGKERVTVRNVDAVKKQPIVGGAKPFTFSCNGSQILFDRCTGAETRSITSRCKLASKGRWWCCIAGSWAMGIYSRISAGRRGC